MIVKEWNGIKRICLISIAVYFLVSVAFYYVGGEDLRYTKRSTPMIDADSVIGEITNGYEIQQEFVVTSETIDSVTLSIATYARQNTGNLVVKLLDDKNRVLRENIIDVKNLNDNSNVVIELDNPIYGMKGEMLTLGILSPEATEGNAITVYYNSEVESRNTVLRINNETINGELAFSVNSREVNFVGRYYFLFALIGLVLLISYCIVVLYKDKRGKKSVIHYIFETSIKYKFLIKQLVSRDFKTKYKRSTLGFMWSFLNPLLTMIIQYIIFSTIFRSNIENFPVYLLTGSIMFNFFTESVGIGLTSIVINASLINKVYVPKYIYPVTKVLSIGINLLISTVPLLLAVIITGESITKAYFLLPFVFICLLFFCVGMTFALSSAMVFFRDTQFLWGIVSLLWMYATPLFYPESIIPSKFSFILTLNPMYYFITFARTVILEGISPQPIIYFACIMYSVFAFILGAWIFKKAQDKFVLYL